jgi:hypothetical protein
VSTNFFIFLGFFFPVLICGKTVQAAQLGAGRKYGSPAFPAWAEKGGKWAVDRDKQFGYRKEKALSLWL